MTASEPALGSMLPRMEQGSLIVVLRVSGRMPLLFIAVLVFVLGASLVMLRRHARQNCELACLRQQLALECQEPRESEEQYRLFLPANRNPMWANDHASRQRELSEEALQESQASLQSLVDNAPFGICRTSIEKDCYDTLNPTLREMLGGYSLQEALQLKISKQVWSDPK